MYKRFKNESSLQSKEIDSLSNEMSKIFLALKRSEKVDTALFIQRQKVKIELDRVKKENESFKIDLNKKIYSRIEVGIEKYCTENEIKVLINTEEKTTLLFIEGELDVTDKFIDFINNEYQNN